MSGVPCVCARMRVLGREVASSGLLLLVASEAPWLLCSHRQTCHRPGFQLLLSRFLAVNCCEVLNPAS